MSKKAVVLLSGGLDSSTCLAIAQNSGFDCYALSFDYGQRGADNEIKAARAICNSLSVSHHKVFQLNTGQFGGSALVDRDIEIPTDDSDEIPITYVPARNTVFLSIALGYAEIIGAFDIFIGANAVDYSGYPDCRPEFIAQFEKLANLATKAGVEGAHFHIQTPLMNLSKAEIVRRGTDLSLDYALTMSCYDSDAEGLACGICQSCQLRHEGFVSAGVPDPTRYVKR